MSNSSNNQKKLIAGSKNESSNDVALAKDTNKRSKLIDLIVNQDAKNKPADPSKVRRNLVDKVKRQIKAGTYETEDKLDKALDRLLDNLLD